MFIPPQRKRMRVQDLRMWAAPVWLTNDWRRSTVWPSLRIPAVSAASLWPPTKSAICKQQRNTHTFVRSNFNNDLFCIDWVPFTMDRHRPAIWADRARRNAAGRTGILCPICGTPSAVFGGHRAPFRASTISWSKLDKHKNTHAFMQHKTSG